MKFQWLILLMLCFSVSVKGQFGPQQIIDADVYGISKIITADLNNDGFSDILTSQIYFNNHKISYFLNTGQASFEPQIILTTDVITPEGVAAGDLNGDGWTDIVGISHVRNSVYWFPNNIGSFPTEISVDSLLIMPEDVEIVDIDNDGDLDIIVLDHTNIVVYYNDGFGNFTKVTVPNDQFEYYAFAVTDLDGDGFHDIVIGSGEVLVYMNDNGQFSTHDVARTASIVNPGLIFLVHAADLDGDGSMDLIIDGNSNSDIRWYANDGNGFFSFMQTMETTHQCKSLSTADFDNDGDMDVFAALFQEGEVGWYENTGQGVFGTQQLVSDGTPPHTVATATADLNNDGGIDVIWAHPFSFHLNTNSLSVNNSGSSLDIHVYPNPVRDRLTVEAALPASLTIFDVMGKSLVENHPLEKGVSELLLPTAQQVYFLRFTSSDGMVVKRVVKE